MTNLMEHLYAIQSAQDPDAFVVIREEPGMYIVGSLVTSIAHFANSFPSAPQELVGVRTDQLKLSKEKDSPYLPVLTPLTTIRSPNPPTSLWYHILGSPSEKKAPKPVTSTPGPSPNAKRKLSYDTDDEIQTPEKRRKLTNPDQAQRTNENTPNHQPKENNNNSNNTNSNWRELSDGLLVAVPPNQGTTRSPNNVTARSFDTNMNGERNDRPTAQPKVKPFIQYTAAAVAAAKEKQQARSAAAPITPTKEIEPKPKDNTKQSRFSEETRKMFSETLHATDNPWITPNYLFLLQGFPKTMTRQKIYDKIEDFFKTDKIATNPIFDVAQHPDNKEIVLLSLENKTIWKRLVDKTFTIRKYSVTFVHVPVDQLPELPREKRRRKSQGSM